ncbi:TIGR02221 family CRISPR-associated protein [Meiothermus granaticius]|uniref:CRISPR-associated protein n=1 Tax=Meiothermus granaticius NBRC 107808 TaxID=1227551 RepID=A0A399F3R3_9DEIN|nr:TIGR02221 family CRISPR-associated protein [Meiothermus granaticius]RIH91334.1 CRISPR-associated protein [Meiothermus granaticius NBRC 107808]GEM88339.1 hypothetical protein MGR01S_29640 [Meiothermus granaticius NBRC 107808]
MQKIVSILGLGRFDKEEKKYYYEKVRYFWEERPVVETALIQEVWNAWFPQAQMLILATKEAKKERKDDLERHPHWIVEDIPDGKNEAEFWQIYQKVVSKLDQGDELILDITHGFRSLPILTLLAASFFRSAKGVTIKHVLYGANEAKTEDKTPVFDLSPFLTMLDWASAAERFLEIGDTSKFHQLTVRNNIPHSLKQGVEELKNLSYAVAANRTFLAGDHASKASCIDQEVQEWDKEFGPIKLLLPKIKEVLSDLSIRQDMRLEELLQQLFGQINWYSNHGYYEKAIGLAREWFITFVQYKCVEYGEIKEPDILDMKDEVRSRWDGAIGRIGPNLMRDREKLEQQVRSVFGERFEFTDEWKGLFGVWQELKDVRNDLLHFGFRSKPKAPNEVKSAVSKCLIDLREEVKKMGLELPEVS